MSGVSGIREELAYRVYAAGWGLVKRLPEKTAYQLFERIADRTWARRALGLPE